jgi:cytochrome c-type biogenesis protein CcmF
LPSVVALVSDTRIVVERSFYDSVAGPLMLLVVFLMGVCPLLGWGRSTWQSLRWRLVYPLITIAVVAVAAFFVFGLWTAMIALVCCFPLYIILAEWWRGTAALRRSRNLNPLRAFGALLAGNRARYGGFIVHVGMILMALGIIASSFFDAEELVTLDVGDTVELGNQTVSYDSLAISHGDEVVQALAHVTVSKDGRTLMTLHPEFNYWFAYDDFFAEAAVRSTAGADLFISMVWTSFNPDDQTATFKLLHSPLVLWMWIGGLLILLGGAFAFTDKAKIKAVDDTP